MFSFWMAKMKEHRLHVPLNIQKPPTEYLYYYEIFNVKVLLWLVALTGLKPTALEKQGQIAIMRDRYCAA